MCAGAAAYTWAGYFIAPGCRLLIAYGISLPENRAYSQIEIFYLGVFDLEDYPYIPCSSRIYIGQIRLLGEYHIYPLVLLIFRSGNGPCRKAYHFFVFSISYYLDPAVCKELAAEIFSSGCKKYIASGSCS